VAQRLRDRRMLMAFRRRRERARQLHRPGRLTVAGAAGSVLRVVGIRTLVPAVVVAALLGAGVAQAAPVVDGNARFTVITPSLIRLEYDAGGSFENGRTQLTDGRLPSRARFRTSV